MKSHLCIKKMIVILLLNFFNKMMEVMLNNDYKIIYVGWIPTLPQYIKV